MEIYKKYTVFSKDHDAEMILNHLFFQLNKSKNVQFFVEDVTADNAYTCLEFGDLHLDPYKLRFEIKGVLQDIGLIEYKIIQQLMRGQTHLTTRNHLMNAVWGDSNPAERALDPHITMLRKKLADCNVEIKTHYGRGFSLMLREPEV